MEITPEQKAAIKALRIGGGDYPAVGPYIEFDIDTENAVLIDGVLTIKELRALVEILDPPKSPLAHRPRGE